MNISSHSDQCVTCHGHENQSEISNSNIARILYFSIDWSISSYHEFSIKKGSFQFRFFITTVAEF